MEEGLEGMVGLGEPMEDLGERGGTFMLPHGPWGPEGMAKLPCSDEVEEERDRCGDASMRAIAGPDMCTGDVTGEGEMEVAAPC